jgi:membrane protein DedA with SNARE-associated domain
MLQRWGYVAVFACVFVEGVGIPAPGQTLLVAGALLASRGELGIAPLLLTTITAATLGNLVGWVVGCRGGRPLLLRFARADRLARVERIFQRSGVALVALGRFVDGARQLNGLAAGAFGMQRGRFLFWNLVGAVFWSTFWGLGAYVMGRDAGGIARAYHETRPFLIAIAVAMVPAVLVWLVARPRS